MVLGSEMRGEPAVAQWATCPASPGWARVQSVVMMWWQLGKALIHRSDLRRPVKMVRKGEEVTTDLRPKRSARFSQIERNASLWKTLSQRWTLWTELRAWKWKEEIADTSGESRSTQTLQGLADLGRKSPKKMMCTEGLWVEGCHPLVYV